MGAKVVHFEIVGRDGKRTQQFYAALFDWQIDANNPMNYGLVAAEPGGIAGGIAGSTEGSRVTFYVAVPDLAAALAKASSLGGRTLLEPHAVPGGPEIALFADPDGNVIGLLKAADA